MLPILIPLGDRVPNLLVPNVAFCPMIRQEMYATMNTWTQLEMSLVGGTSSFRVNPRPETLPAWLTRNDVIHDLFMPFNRS